jgi:MEMO1 family protein
MRHKTLLILTGAVCIAAALVAFLIVSRGMLHGERPVPMEQKKPEAGAVARPAAVHERKVLESRLAGTWYDANPAKLDAEITGYLAAANQPPLDNVIGLILPHAGYRYSGQTAAYGVAALGGKQYGRVVVMGPSHSVPLKNAASVPDATHYATPLGEVRLDTGFIAALKRSPLFTTVPEMHEREHSVQIELPLLQKVLQSFELVPIVVGQVDVGTAKQMAGVLRGLVDSQTLVVASSDFTHYGATYDYVPFTEDVAENLRKLDMGAFTEIEKKDPDAFAAYVASTGATICGRSPIEILLAMLPPDAKVQLLHYDTSGAKTGDYALSVSYLAAAFMGVWPTEATESGRAALFEMEWPPEDQQRLLELARKTLTYAVSHRSAPDVEDLGVAVTGAMREVAGVFVTLTANGRLRGCIGEIEPCRPVYQAVMAHAVNAGLADRRFPPVTEAELDTIDFEISVLTPPQPIPSCDRILLGRDGIVLENGGRRAVFLPQVAPEQGWDLDQTLTQLALKAGLPSDAWRQGASFEVFQAMVFSEGAVSDVEAAGGPVAALQ